MGSLAIQINSQIRELLRRANWSDIDGFSLRLAREVTRQLSTGLSVQDAVKAAVFAPRTSFFKVNRVRKQEFANQLSSILDSAGIREATTLEHIEKFKQYAERQLVTDLRRDDSERNARALLQTYMASTGRTYREVSVSGGQSDVLLFNNSTFDLIEVKIWRGKTYHTDGLEELFSYLKGEGLKKGYYVVFEFYKVKPITPERETLVNVGTTIEVVCIHIPKVPPSKIGREKRRQAESQTYQEN